ncbi:hypothetical protein GKZ90_0006820 [Flavobacterium sp. MC2016-06]|jgi:hypothetical protein|uniref:hypothetical protein n=1 Tax=Flavobacterium sp. MC2016-06 TaxID=2676308 RepID=UPI0012BABB32|nr:hypothetical protein [Flavobacterium sp. MC2016-06]MBU3857852.1 hypothetical protein [Flavobacterium sp. MC2016-06]
MLKKIFNLEKIELLTSEQLKSIIGGGEVQPKCIVFAPPGSSGSSYPFYPCAHNPGTVPTLCPDPNDDFAPPIIC